MGRYTGDLIEVSNGPSIRHGNGTYLYTSPPSSKVPNSSSTSNFVVAGESLGGESKLESGPSFRPSFYSYSGSWRNGVKDGKGSFTLLDHSVYEGDFLGGEMTGQGRREYGNGSWYEGSWVEGEREGYGTEFLKEKEMRYEGNWKGNKREGKGKLTWGKEQKDFVEGVFVNHKIQGDGGEEER